MKKSLNPRIAALTKSHRERTYALGGLRAQEIDGKRCCVWCGEGDFKNKLKKWCSQDCVNAALAWGYPQGTESAGVLLIKQDFKCATCAFDFGSIVEAMLNTKPRPYGWSKIEAQNFRQTYNYWLVKKLKAHVRKSIPERRIEIDHIEPIAKGGSPLARENLQLCCSKCHLEKTKIDNSGPRKRKRKAKSVDRFPHHEICGDCAEAYGAKWPEGHLATCWEDTCPYCKKENQALCALSDWSWPKLNWSR